MAAAPSIVNIVGAQELAIYSDPDDTLWMSEVVSFTNFSYNVVKVQGAAGTKYLPTKTFLGHGYGDLISTIYLEFLFPALAVNSTATDAHYVNSLGYAAIDTFSLKCGTQICELKHGRWMEAIIEMCYPPGNRYEELIGTFKTDSELIQFAQSDNRLLVPILLSQTRWLHNAIPAISLHHSAITYEVKLFSLDTITVNLGAATVVPYKYGTTTALANSDVDVNLFMTCIFLDDCERALFLCSDLKYIITQVQETVQPVTATGAFNISGFSLNHPLKYGFWMLQRAESIDGTTYTRRSVGVKDKFDYCANHGGESLSDMKWTVNGQQLWNSDDLPPVFLRQIRPRESFPYASTRNIYMWNFGPDCDKWNPTQTVNFSRIDNTKFEAKNNNTTFTTGNLFFYVENVNLFMVYGGIGGCPFTS